jgi:hypothetical protein
VVHFRITSFVVVALLIGAAAILLNLGLLPLVIIIRLACLLSLEHVTSLLEKLAVPIIFIFIVIVHYVPAVVNVEGVVDLFVSILLQPLRRDLEYYGSVVERFDI